MKTKQISLISAMIASLIILGACAKTPEVNPTASIKPAQTESPTSPSETKPSVTEPAGETKNLDGDTSMKEGSLFKMADIDGDGFDEKIVLDPVKTGSPSYYTSFTIRVGDSAIEANYEDFEPDFSVVDIDDSDEFMEIAVSSYGPSSDLNTAFYHYDGKNLKFMGEIQGFYGMTEWGEGELKIDGSGKIRTLVKTYFIQTWFHEEEYLLKGDLSFEKVGKDLYAMNTDVVLLGDLTLYKERGQTAPGIALTKGDEVLLKDTDDKEWCSVVTKSGETGWIAVDEDYKVRGTSYFTYDLFEGLTIAD